MTALRRTGVPPWQVASILAVGAFMGAALAGSAVVAAQAAAAAALVIALTVRPELATALLAFVVWMNLPALSVDRYGVPVAAGALFPFVLLVPIAYGHLRGRAFVLTRGAALMLLLLAVELLSTAFAAHQDVAVDRLRTFALEGVVLYILIVNAIDSVSALRLAIWGMLAAGACLALVTIYQQLTGTWFRPYGGFGQVEGAFYRGQTDVARLAGPLGDPNYYAQVLLPLVPLGFLTIRRERGRLLRVAAGAITLLVALAMTYTYSRGAGIALLVLLVAMAAMGYLRARHFVAVAAGLAILLAAVPAYRDRVASIATIGGATARAGEQTSADESSRSRTTEMLAGGLAFLDHPELGVGPGGFPFYYQQYAPRVGIEVHEKATSGADKGEAAKRAAHDLFIGVAADLGAVGLAVFTAILGFTAAGLLRVRRRWAGVRPDLVNLADSLLLALLAYVVAGLFLSLAFERYLWLLVALGGALIAVASQARSRPEP
jgi:putative inorganic carbon (HCO3(-)) transporter